MELLWYRSASLEAEYGQFICMVCGKVFTYSPRLDCHCNMCALSNLHRRLAITKDVARRQELHDYIVRLIICV
ncbi:hypothetical protein F0L74_21555 [Chitinophaga agrisoli]|uniref:C2H2-type domain-containing protein n=1 Tax=Chitinophaga agrisoli TaxID=2607653 RepID=A0A5B2VGV4_9BACT|nr:hypothetical protein [Chitinophaga agrisoli]KAA2238803.1 hypothetical protein F0L74_21555 [Chitinophaga agrisoli]